MITGGVCVTKIFNLNIFGWPQHFENPEKKKILKFGIPQNYPFWDTTLVAGLWAHSVRQSSAKYLALSPFCLSYL